MINYIVPSSRVLDDSNPQTKVLEFSMSLPGPKIYFKNMFNGLQFVQEVRKEH